MTDYYKLLGIEKNASKEEIKEAYEKQVENIKKEVDNKKRLNQFLKIFDEAYEALNNEIEENQVIDEDATLILNSQEVKKELELSNKNGNSTAINDSRNRRGNRISSKNDLTQKRILRSKDDKNKRNDDKVEKGKKYKKLEKSSESSTKEMLKIFMLPFKILALPLIVILSVVILLLQLINIISWIVTKVLIVASISIGAIHLYQVKLGQPINYNILIIAGSVLAASFFLPYILKVILKVCGKSNDLLKKFVF